MNHQVTAPPPPNLTQKTVLTGVCSESPSPFSDSKRLESPLFKKPAAEKTGLLPELCVCVRVVFEHSPDVGRGGRDCMRARTEVARRRRVMRSWEAYQDDTILCSPTQKYFHCSRSFNEGSHSSPAMVESVITMIFPASFSFPANRMARTPLGSSSYPPSANENMRMFILCRMIVHSFLPIKDGKREPSSASLFLLTLTLPCLPTGTSLLLACQNASPTRFSTLQKQ